MKSPFNKESGRPVVEMSPDSVHTRGLEEIRHSLAPRGQVATRVSERTTEKWPFFVGPSPIFWCPWRIQKVNLKRVISAPLHPFIPSFRPQESKDALMEKGIPGYSRGEIRGKKVVWLD